MFCLLNVNKDFVYVFITREDKAKEGEGGGLLARLILGRTSQHGKNRGETRPLDLWNSC